MAGGVAQGVDPEFKHQCCSNNNNNDERQDCKTGTVWWGALVGGKRVNGGEEGEGIWLMGFTSTY
jgi:hypothetical protein